MKPGIYNISNEEYHADNSAISKSGLDLIAKSPAHFKWTQENNRPPTPAMQKGTLVHLLALEPDQFDSEYVVMPADIKVKRGKAWEAFRDENIDRSIISASDLTGAQAIVSAVQSNPEAIKILESALAIEESVFAEDPETGILCKCRPDIRIDGAIYDLKTTKNAQAKAFSYSCRSFRYHVQAAFYLDVCRNQGIDVSDFGFIAVDTADMPFQCTVFHAMDDDAMNLGRGEYIENLKTYAECVEADLWPGYPESYDFLSLAGHAYDQTEEESC